MKNIPFCKSRRGDRELCASEEKWVRTEWKQQSKKMKQVVWHICVTVWSILLYDLTSDTHVLCAHVFKGEQHPRTLQPRSFGLSSACACACAYVYACVRGVCMVFVRVCKCMPLLQHAHGDAGEQHICELLQLRVGEHADPLHHYIDE